MSDSNLTEQIIEAITALLGAIRYGQLGDRKVVRAQVDIARNILQGIRVEDGTGPHQ